MSDTAHILEEMRSLRGAHADLMSKMSEVCVQMRELVTELRHTQRNYDSLSERMLKTESEIRSLQLEAALNKPILDIVRSVNTKMLITVITTALGLAAMQVDWSKFAGN